MNASYRFYPLQLMCLPFFCLLGVDVAGAQPLGQQAGFDRLIEATTPQASGLPAGAVPLTTQQALRAFPAGDQIGTLFPKTKIVKGEERGDWVKVTVEGWVPKKSLEETAAPAVSEAPRGVLAITDFSVERIGKRIVGGDKDVIKLVLRVKNGSEATVNSWEGFLQAHLATGHQLFAIPISSENKPIPAGGSVELSFVWKDGEARFSDLDGRTKADMTLALSGIQIRH